MRDGSVQWPEDKDFSLFFEENTAAELIPIFKEQFDSAKFITIRDRDNKPVGRAVVNGSVKLSTVVTFWVGLGNLLTSRVMWLVWPLIAFGIYLAIKMEPIWGTQNLQPEFVSKFKNFKAGPILSIFNTSSSKTPSANSLSEPERSFELGSSMLFWGKYESSFLTRKSVLASVSAATWQTPDLSACTSAPPNSSKVTSS